MRVTAAAGEPWDAVVAAAVARGGAGLECLSGIPGLAGGTPIQNVGAYGQEVASVIERVTVFDRERGTVRGCRPRRAASPTARAASRRADAGRFVVCEVAFRLRKGPPTTAYADVAAALERPSVAQPTVADVRGGRPGDPAAQGHGDRRRRSGHAQRRLVFHQPDRQRGAASGSRRAPARRAPAFAQPAGR